MVTGLAVTMLPLALSDVGAGATSSSAGQPPSPATGHAQVIAQGVVIMGGGAYAWTMGEIGVETTERPLVAETATFLLAGDGAVDVRGAEGTSVRLAPGEATFRPAGSSAAVQAGGPAAVGVITVAPAASGQACVFTPGAGPHDVDLLRDVLAPAEALSLPAGLPAFVVVTSGAVNDHDTTLEPGAAALVAGGQSLSNPIDHGAATVVVAVIGPTITIGPPTSTSTSTSTSAPAATTTVAPAPTPTVTTVPPTPPPTTVPPTTVPTTVSPDSDDDGLTDAEEAELGTDPSDQDSDDDGLNDGREHFDVGTDRADPDTDGDGRTDGGEMSGTDFPSDPTDPDTDDDGLNDGEEAGDWEPTRTTQTPTAMASATARRCTRLHAPAQAGHRRRLLR